MIRRRLVPLALVVTALVALAALAAHGRPLSGGGLGVGPSAAFYDYAFTTVLIVVLLAAVATLVALYALRRGPEERKPYQARTFRALVTLLAAAALLALLGRHVNLEHLLHPHQATTAQTLTTPPPGAGKAHPPRPAAPRHVQFRWQELAAVLGLLLLLVAAGARRSRRGPPRLRESAQEELAAILDESLDDLRSDPDLRRAIVAAYARMEAALAAAGVPRHPAEAPLEYLERALLALDASAPAVRRLTELFEWARFSHHEPEPRMRDEAVDALAAVRDELRAAEPVPA